MPDKPSERCRNCEVVTVSDGELCRRVSAGDRHAESEIVERYTPLVRKLVAGSNCPVQVDHDDLVQAGLLSVLKAAKKFDPSRGCKFVTLAWRYVARDVHKAMDREVRITRGHFQERGDDIASLAATPERELPEGLATSLNQLRPLALAIVRMAFGLDGEPVGIVQIARRFDLSKRDADSILTQALVTLGADPSQVVALPTSRPTSVRRRRAKSLPCRPA